MMLNVTTLLRECLTGFSALWLLHSPMYTSFFRNESLSRAHCKALPDREGSIDINYLTFFHKKDMTILPYLFLQLNIYSYQHGILHIHFVFYVDGRQDNGSPGMSAL